MYVLTNCAKFCHGSFIRYALHIKILYYFFNYKVISFYLKTLPTVLMVLLRSFGKIAVSFIFVTLANSRVMDCISSGSIIIVRFELLGLWKASNIANNSSTFSVILVISTVEQFSTFGACQTAGSPSHDLDASPIIIIINLIV